MIKSSVLFVIVVCF